MFAFSNKGPINRVSSERILARSPHPQQNIPWLGSSAAEQIFAPHRPIGNQALLRLLAQRTYLPGDKSIVYPEHELEPSQIASPIAMPNVTWDFSNIQVFGSDRPSGPQTPFQFIQPKFAIRPVDDPFEHEADGVADTVMQIQSVAHGVSQGPAKISPKQVVSKNEQTLLPTEVRTVLSLEGEPLSPSVRTTMESRFSAEPLAVSTSETAQTSSAAVEQALQKDRLNKADFSKVRIHTGARADAAALAVRARAFSVGSDIVFKTGEYQPDSLKGRWLLAHELAHVSQQRTANVRPLSRLGDASEREADAAANAIAGGQMATIGATCDAIVQRQPDAGSSPESAIVRKNYLILYDASDDESKRQAEQTAKDHSTTAHVFDETKLNELVKQKQPDVIMTFGHGARDARSMSMGTGLRKYRGEKTITSELEKAGQTKPICFVAQACNVGAEGGLMDKLQSTPSLKNYTFASHTDIGHPTRNQNIRVSGGASFPDFLTAKFVAELGAFGFDKTAAAGIINQMLQPRMVAGDPNSEAEMRSQGTLNTVIREVSVLGFEKFWELVKVDNPDVANDPAVLELNMTKEAKDRFAAGIKEFRTRLLKAVEQQMQSRMKKPVAPNE